MEAIFFKILSEQGLITSILVWTLYFILKIMKWWINQYLLLIQEHNQKFLDSLNKIVLNNWKLTETVIEWNKNHTNEHAHIVTTMQNIDANVQKNTEIIKEVHKDILFLHKKSND